MKSISPIISGFIAALLLFAGCKSDEGDIFSPIPEISLISVHPTEVTAFKDSIHFDLSYSDGDGDLGSNNASDRNLFVIDNRIDVTHSFRLQNIVPNGEAVPITGTLTIILPNTLITDGSTSQEVTFTLYLTDRAGNESNRVTTPAVVVKE